MLLMFTKGVGHETSTCIQSMVPVSYYLVAIINNFGSVLFNVKLGFKLEPDN